MEPKPIRIIRGWTVTHCPEQPDKNTPHDYAMVEWSNGVKTGTWYMNLNKIEQNQVQDNQEWEKNLKAITTNPTIWWYTDTGSITDTTEEHQFDMNTNQISTFSRVPVMGHPQGLKVPVSPFYRGKQDNIYVTTTLTADVDQYYLAELEVKPHGMGDFQRKFHSLQTVTETEWKARVVEFENQLMASGQRYQEQQTDQWDNHPELTKPTRRITNILEVPPVRPEFIPDTKLESFCTLLDEMAQNEGRPKNGLVLGVTAAGKTFGVEQAAAKLGRLFIRIDMSKVGEIYDLVGPMLAVEDNGVPVTKWIPSAFIKAMQDPRPKWILLDELNRTQSPHALNFLMPLLDDSHRSYFDEGEAWVEMDPKTVIFATQNGDVRGNDTGDYVGTQPLDQAIVSRFPARVQVHYPSEPKIVEILNKVAPQLEIKEIKLIAAVATELSKQKYQMPNLRELVEAAKIRQMGKSLYQALSMTVGGLYPYNQTPDCPFMTFRATLQGKGITLEALDSD